MALPTCDCHACTNYSDFGIPLPIVNFPFKQRGIEYTPMDGIDVFYQHLGLIAIRSLQRNLHAMRLLGQGDPSYLAGREVHFLELGGLLCASQKPVPIRSKMIARGRWAKGVLVISKCNRLIFRRKPPSV